MILSSLIQNYLNVECVVAVTQEKEKLNQALNSTLYYHCTGKGKIKTCKKESYISQDKIDKIMAEIIKGLENIPQTLIDEIKDTLKETHDLKNNYSDNAQKNITKRINEIDRLIQAGYQRLLKNNNKR